MNKTSPHRLSPTALRRLAAQHKVTPAGLHLIERIRTSPPSRRTQGKHSVRGFYPSKKMGLTIQFESHRGELPAILMLEHDCRVSEFYDQAGEVKLTYPKKDGRMTGCTSTPDFFVIGTEYLGWIECKPERELRELSKDMPNRYVRQIDGTWRCPPGEAYAAKFGLSYRIYVADHESAELVRNLNFLDEYYLRAYPAPANKLIEKVKEVVKNDQGITYPALLAKIKGWGLTVDDLNYLISRGVVYTDLRRVLLADSETVKIYTDRIVAAADEAVANSKAVPVSQDQGPVHLVPSAKIRWRGEEHTIIDASEELVHLLSASGKSVALRRTDLELAVCAGQAVGISPSHGREQVVMNLMAQAGPEKIRQAVHRWQKIQPILEDRRRMARVPKHERRTVNRWLDSFRRAKLNLGTGFVGLLPDNRTGFAGSHLSALVEELILKVIVEDYEKPASPTMTHVYGLLIAACERLGVTPPSFKTFRKRVNARPQHPQTRKRKGPRAANQRAKFYYYLDQTTPVHGDRPWEIGHIDHTQLDIEVVCPRTGKNLGRPWLTTLVDARTRRILAIHVSLFSESRESCLMVLRECVRRHNRLPQTLVVDNGRAFNSNYFDALLATFSIKKKSRPPAHPRFGSICERLFGTINTEFIHNLRGNTKLTKNVRLVTKSFDPKNHAVWSLGELIERLECYCYEVYDTKHHSTLGQSPRAEMACLMEATGSRQHVLIPYDWLFRILTLPTTTHGFAKVHCQKGVRVNYLDYWNDAFDDAEVEGTEVAVRYDPWDASTAYAFVKGQWVCCISALANVFKNWSQRAIALATDQLRAQHRANGKARTINASRLAKFMEEVKNQEEFLQLRARENATHRTELPTDKPGGFSTASSTRDEAPPCAPDSSEKTMSGFDDPRGPVSPTEIVTE